MEGGVSNNRTSILQKVSLTWVIDFTTGFDKAAHTHTDAIDFVRHDVLMFDWERVNEEKEGKKKKKGKCKKKAG
jgi:Fic family protein